MEEPKKVTDATVVKDAPKKEVDSATATETDTEATAPGTSWPWVPFVAGILVTILGWQLYSVVTQEKPNNEDVVATVGGLTITQDELSQSLTQAEALAAQQGVDIADPGAQTILEEQALEALINTKILINAAQTADFSVSEEEISTQIDTVAEQFGGLDGLLTQAETLGLDETELREDIAEQLTVDQYLRSVVDIEAIAVTPEEILSVYDELTEAGQELPPLADIEAGIEAQLLAQKQQEAVAAHIDALRTETTIEIE